MCEVEQELPEVQLTACPVCDSDDVHWDPDSETWSCRECLSLITQTGVEMLHGDGSAESAAIGPLDQLP